MIVQCDKCQSKFKVDDARIPDAGINARCSVCRHTFHLTREPEVVDLGAKSIFGQEDPSVSAKLMPEQPAGDWDFSGFIDGEEEGLLADEAVGPGAGTDVEIVEEALEQLSDEAIVAEIQDEHGEADEFSADSGDIETNPAYKAFALWANQVASGQSHVDDQPLAEPVDTRMAPASAAPPPAATAAGNSEGKTDSENSHTVEHPQVKAAAPDSSDSQTCSPARGVMAADQRVPQLCDIKASNREIVELLDDTGLTDTYIVRKVQEICEATKYVEGVEKPDWPTRIAGLDILCKIKGLYPPEKRDDAGNRQVQIVTGINM